LYQLLTNDIWWDEIYDLTVMVCYTMQLWYFCVMYAAIEDGLHFLDGLKPGASALDAEILVEEGAVPALGHAIIRDDDFGALISAASLHEAGYGEPDHAWSKGYGAVRLIPRTPPEETWTPRSISSAPGRPASVSGVGGPGHELSIAVSTAGATRLGAAPWRRAGG
jgi:hypothetical protein